MDGESLLVVECRDSTEQVKIISAALLLELSDQAVKDSVREDVGGLGGPVWPRRP